MVLRYFVAITLLVSSVYAGKVDIDWYGVSNVSEDTKYKINSRLKKVFVERSEAFFVRPIVVREGSFFDDQEVAKFSVVDFLCKEGQEKELRGVLLLNPIAFNTKTFLEEGIDAFELLEYAIDNGIIRADKFMNQSPNQDLVNFQKVELLRGMKEEDSNVVNLVDVLAQTANFDYRYLVLYALFYDNIDFLDVIMQLGGDFHIEDYKERLNLRTRLTNSKEPACRIALGKIKKIRYENVRNYLWHKSNIKGLQGDELKGAIVWEEALFLEKVKLLHHYGMDLESNLGNLVLSCAVASGMVRVLDYLYDQELLGRGHVEVVQMAFDGYRAACEQNDRGYLISVLKTINWLGTRLFFELKDDTYIKTAARMGDMDLVKQLIENGADPACEGCLDAAQQSENKALEMFFEEHLLQRRLYNAARRGNVESVDSLVVDRGADLYHDEFVFNAVKSGSPQMILKGLKVLDEIYVDMGGLDAFVVVGISNVTGEFSGALMGLAKEVLLKDRILSIPLNGDILAHDELMSYFTALINPGNGDTFPTDRENFGLEDLVHEEQWVTEQMYQNVIKYAQAHNLMYLGICSGNQHLVLSQGGHLMPVQDHLENSLRIDFKSNTLNYFMTLSDREKREIYLKCADLGPVSIKEGKVDHSYAGKRGHLGSGMVLSGVSEGGVVEAVHKGVNLIGFQFHPEKVYFKSQRDKNIIEAFFGMARLHKKATVIALDSGYSLEEARETAIDKLEITLEPFLGCTSDYDLSDTLVWHPYFGDLFLDSDTLFAIRRIYCPFLLASQVKFSVTENAFVLKDRASKQRLSIPHEVLAYSGLEYIEFADGEQVSRDKLTSDFDCLCRAFNSPFQPFREPVYIPEDEPLERKAAPAWSRLSDLVFSFFKDLLPKG